MVKQVDDPSGGGNDDDDDDDDDGDDDDDDDDDANEEEEAEKTGEGGSIAWSLTIFSQNLSMHFWLVMSVFYNNCCFLFVWFFFFQWLQSAKIEPSQSVIPRVVVIVFIIVL
jgi:hypothetical protein